MRTFVRTLDNETIADRPRDAYLLDALRGLYRSLDYSTKAYRRKD